LFSRQVPESPIINQRVCHEIDLHPFPRSHFFHVSHWMQGHARQRPEPSLQNLYFGSVPASSSQEGAAASTNQTRTFLGGRLLGMARHRQLISMAPGSFRQGPQELGISLPAIPQGQRSMVFHQAPLAEAPDPGSTARTQAGPCCQPAQHQAASREERRRTGADISAGGRFKKLKSTSRRRIQTGSSFGELSASTSETTSQVTDSSQKPLQQIPGLDPEQAGNWGERGGRHEGTDAQMIVAKLGPRFFGENGINTFVFDWGRRSWPQWFKSEQDTTQLPRSVLNRSLCSMSGSGSRLTPKTPDGRVPSGCLVSSQTVTLELAHAHTLGIGH